MEVACGGRAAGMAREARRRLSRRRAAGAAPEEDGERLSAAFATIVKLMRGVSKECENYYGTKAVNKCKENEINHFCKYHAKSVERKTEEGRTTGSVERSQAQTCQQSPRRGSKDFYIEVSPGIYSVTAISEDMEQTQVIDVNAGQSVDLTFVL